MLLIGYGGTGNATTGGGGAAVAVWYGAAQHVPNSLRVVVPTGAGNPTQIQYVGASTTPITIFTAEPASGPTGGSVTTVAPFNSSGFLSSAQGPTGTSGSASPSSVSFLGGGGNSPTTANYGYKNTGSGYFQLQPIIVGVGSGAITGNGGIGCGGGQTGGKGGNGFVLIASW